MPLIYKDAMLVTDAQWTVSQKLAEELMIKVQIASLFRTKFTRKDFEALDRMIAQLLTAPRGLIPEC